MQEQDDIEFEVQVQDQEVQDQEAYQTQQGLLLLYRQLQE